MVDKEKYDLSYRPESYLVFKDWKVEVLSHVTGEIRHNILAAAINDAGIAKPEDFVNAVIGDLAYREFP